MSHCRPGSHRRITPPAEGWALPAPGDEVAYRGDCCGEQVPAVVLAVDMDDDTRSDSNVWGAPDQYGRILPDPDAPYEAKVLLPDPRPNVTLRAADGFELVTRAIRYVGSPGWSWPGQDS